MFGILRRSHQELLAGGMEGHTPLKIGPHRTERRSCRYSCGTNAARHMAIMAMTVGKDCRSKTGNSGIHRYRLSVIDSGPHGDYLGLWEKRKLFPKTEIQIVYPHIVMTQENQRIVDTLISKMTEGTHTANRNSSIGS